MTFVRPSLLFVYGTLMSTSGSVMGQAPRERLQRESVSRGAASIRGRLYDLGRYPGLVEDAAGEHVVHGEAYELASAEQSLRWLDSYEGIVSGPHAHNEYERAERTIMLAAGGEATAWVYLYRRPVLETRRIADGRWPGMA
jgi:gamma-glutamylcyclotransferase (GGCT)/AIG2-like uncharacterized protein YtfP